MIDPSDTHDLAEIASEIGAGILSDKLGIVSEIGG